MWGILREKKFSTIISLPKNFLCNVNSYILKVWENIIGWHPEPQLKLYRVFRKYVAKIRGCVPEMILNTNHQMSIVPNLNSLGVTPCDRSARNKLESDDCE